VSELSREERVAMRERWGLGKEEGRLKFDLVDSDAKTTARKDILCALDALDAAEAVVEAVRHQLREHGLGGPAPHPAEICKALAAYDKVVGEHG